MSYPNTGHVSPGGLLSVCQGLWSYLSMPWQRTQLIVPWEHGAPHQLQTQAGRLLSNSRYLVCHGCRASAPTCCTMNIMNVCSVPNWGRGLLLSGHPDSLGVRFLLFGITPQSILETIGRCLIAGTDLELVLSENLHGCELLP